MMNEYERLQKRLTSQPLLDIIASADKLYKESRFDEAISMYNNVLVQLDESFAFDRCELYRKIGNCYYAQQNKDGARRAYEKTLDYCTTNGSIYAILAYLYYYVDNDIAIDYYTKTVEITPTDEVSLSSKCLTILKSHKYSQKMIKETFEKDMEKFKSIIMRNETPYSHKDRDLKNKKKLHIGYLSSDFYSHAMMQFILPLLENHNLDKFDFTLYSTTKKTDHVTEKIKNLGMRWQDCRELTNKQLAKVIYDDNVDILIDLSGFTHCRCFSLFYKPAPVQMQYLGFVNTMGMKDIDYIFADDYTIPKDMAKYYTEKPLYLNTWMQRFDFNKDDPKWPAINELPYKKNGYITFGSFNCPSKINDYTIELWSKLLKNVENSKLLVYRTQMTNDVIERFKGKFAKCGIGMDRLIFNNMPFTGPHFYVYQMADIALDPTPFNGLTVTLELIAMGIPVLTLAGKSMQSRGCARINKALKLDDLVAENEEQYIKKAQRLAKNIYKLEKYRNTLRDTLAKSILVTDKKGFAKHVEDAYLKAWQTYCKTL